MDKHSKQLRRKMAGLFVGVLLFTVVGVVAAPAPASALKGGYYGHLISKDSRMCLAAPAVTGPPWSAFQMNCATNDVASLWHMQHIGNGYFKIRSVWNNCLDVYAYSHANQALVTTWPCQEGASNQEWTVGQSWDGFTLKPRHARYDNWGTGKCLDVFAFSHSEGGQITQWNCWGGTNQLWSYDAW